MHPNDKLPRPKFAALHLVAAAMTILPLLAFGHGTLVNGRMYQVRVAGANGHTPAVWNDSYYTWNQNSHNFPDYAAPNFSYATTVPDATIAYAGINDGVQSSLNFVSLSTPSASWIATPATAGQNLALHFVATAPHDPSFFQVYLTKQGYDAATQQLTWSMLENLGRWSTTDSNHPVTNATAPSPAGGTSLSYDWNITIPADRGGRHVVVVIWQRVDPAGEAFFAAQDLQVTPAASNNLSPTLGVTSVSSDAVHLELRAAPNQSWTILKTDDLNSPNWTTLTTATTNASGILDVTDGNPNAAARFYHTTSQ